MQKTCKKFGIRGLLLLLMLLFAGMTMHLSTNEAQAATAGFKTVNGKTYYYKSNGKKHTGWLTLKGKKYYFTSKSGVMVTGWLTNSKGQKRYFDKKTGVMATGWKTINKKKYYFYSKSGVMATGWLKDSKGAKRYFNKKTGVMTTGWLTLSGKKYYFYSGSGKMATGWLTDSKGNKRYFNKSTGVMATGYQTISKKKYYFYSGNGKMATGWLTDSKGNKRYFNKSTGVMATGWYKDSSGRRYFDTSTGIMKTGWQTIDSNKYYFSTNTGIAATGFMTDSSKKTYYFYSSSGAMATGWVTNTKGQKRYFDTSSGVMYTGFKTISSKKYYFYSGSGIMATGWLTNSSGAKRYFDETTGVMATGTKTINGTKYTFGSDGILTVNTSSGVDISQPSSARTIKNYLLGAMQPVGQALYVWGGGWNDSTRKGVSPTWKQWYDSQTSSYNYKNYNDLSTTNRAKGLDCSGFVGWAAYQVMQTKSGVGGGYTVVAEDVGSYYKSLGWGSIITQSQLSSANWTLKPGDVGYNSGHTWIVVGQCSDKSVVIVHSTPQAGCQISGTPTPSGNYSSEAITLAKKYMSKYTGYSKYDYHTSSGNYIRNGQYFRWSSSVLSDPDGYKNMTAAQILADLFS